MLMVELPQSAPAAANAHPRGLSPAATRRASDAGACSRTSARRACGAAVASAPALGCGVPKSGQSSNSSSSLPPAKRSRTPRRTAASTPARDPQVRNRLPRRPPCAATVDALEPSALHGEGDSEARARRGQHRGRERSARNEVETRHGRVSSDRMSRDQEQSIGGRAMRTGNCSLLVGSKELHSKTQKAALNWRSQHTAVI
eukprot:4761476-Pleurochrysis_carterae.AAC.3